MNKRWNGLPNNPELSGWHWLRYNDDIGTAYPEDAYEAEDSLSGESQFTPEYWSGKQQIWLIPGWEPYGVPPARMAECAAYLGRATIPVLAAMALGFLERDPDVTN